MSYKCAVPGTTTTLARINGVPWYGALDITLPIRKVAYIHECWWENSKRWVYVLCCGDDAATVEIWADIVDTGEFLGWFYELMKIGVYERRYTEFYDDAQIWEETLTFS